MVAEPKILYISFFDAINPVTVSKFMRFTVDAVNEHNPTELYFLISSAGGDVDSGFTLFNFLVALQGKLTVTMHNIGQIDSIANVVFLAGQKRFAAPNAAFLFHGIVMNMAQGGQGRASLKELISRLDSMETRMAQTISQNSQLSEDELKEFFKQGEGIDVTFALAKGMINEIRVPSIPPNSVHLAMSFV